MNRLIVVLFCLIITACAQFQELQMFDSPPPTAIPPDINGFYGLEIYKDDLNNDHWRTENLNCIKIEQVPAEIEGSKKALRIQWDKDKGICDYIGMGFGWNGWMAKDMNAIYDSAALSFYVKPVNGTFNNLPVAIAFEDYSGRQAWLGFNPNTIKDTSIGNGWILLEFPLSEFDWKVQGANLGNVKQLIIQFEAVGDFLLDEIKITPRIGGFAKRYHANYLKNGELENQYFQKKHLDLDNVQIFMSANEDELHFEISGKNNAPLDNYALVQFYLRSLPGFKPGINRFASYDNNILVDFLNGTTSVTHNGEILDNSRYEITKSNEKVVLKMKLKHLEINPLLFNKVYLFDVALQDKSNKRFTWNSPKLQNTHLSPHEWGELVFVKPQHGFTKINN